MKRVLLALALATSFIAPVCAASAAAAADSMAHLAPADRYFGRLKMSILGVRNQLKDLSLRADAHPEDAEHIFDKAVMVEDALHDWHAHFPRDPWLPRYTYSLAQLYAKLDYDEARVRRNDTLDWLIATFPASEYAMMPRE